MKKYLFYSLGILISFIVLGCEPICSSLETKDITDMYSPYVEEWKKESAQSFNRAEKEVFVKPDVPKPDDGTNPDASKCICKGTGIIVQGDGHKTVCPYHGRVSSKGK